MRGSHVRLLLAVGACFTVAAIAARKATVAHCYEAVASLPTADGRTVREALGSRGWTVGPRVVHGDHVWTCTDDPIPLVLASSASARALTPSRSSP